MNATPVTGIVRSSDLTGLQAPGATRYAIDFNRPDGTVVTGTTGHPTVFAYVWPSFAKVEPERLYGKRVCGFELPSGHLWWFFVEPPAGSQCGTGALSSPTPPPPMGSLDAIIGPPGPPSGDFSPSGTPESGGAGGGGV